MKKIISSLLMFSGMASISTFAGGPEMIPPPPPSTITPYIDFQMGGAWLDIAKPLSNHEVIIDGDPVTFNTHSQENNLAGRLAIGAEFPIFNRFKFISEIGYGYYGQQKFFTDADVSTGPDFSTFLRVRSWAFDVVAGLSMSLVDNFSIFVKGGGMIENYSNHFKLFDDTTGDEIVNIIEKRSEVLPVVMAGLEYDPISWIGIKATYIHGFGDTYDPIRISGTDEAPFINVKIRHVAPTVDAVMGGIVLKLPS